MRGLPLAKWKPSTYVLIASMGGMFWRVAAPASSVRVFAVLSAPGESTFDAVLPPPQAVNAAASSKAARLMGILMGGGWTFRGVRDIGRGAGPRRTSAHAITMI